MTGTSSADRIGIFGGTFDPIHYGHLECAQCAKEALGLDKVMFLPCHSPNFKRDQRVAPATDRLEMCRLACAGNPDFMVSDLEIERGGITYTVDTVEELQSELGPGFEPYLILGTDAFMSVSDWRESERLASMVTFAVVSRPGDALHDAIGLAERSGIRMIPIECPGMDISSSLIRQLLAEGRSARYLAPDSVLAYARRRGLYDIGEPGFRSPDSDASSAGGPTKGNGARPAALSERFFKARWEDLKGRVSKKRLRHIEGVAETSRELAKLYGVDEESAYLAGLLHDWDKALDDDQIRARVRDLGIADEIDPFVMREMPQVLHGPTAARALSQEYPEIPDDVIRAIKEHTTSSTDPDDLSKILYIADVIEPSRSFDDADELRSMVGKVTLDELFTEIYKFWTLALVKRGRPLHPETVNIWNALTTRRDG